MSIIGVGTDLVDLVRFRTAMQRTASLSDRLFSPDERAYASEQHDPAKTLAARFAAKEAVMKALGVGLGDFDFHDVEVLRCESGAPALVVRGRAERLAVERGVTGWHLSLSHTESVAVALVVAVAD